ncbi:LysM peptidoglycan-binding domain-containing protein [Limosilactobacillus reuteri subsp. suis]|uniref:aggregation-promoting factor n=1 Tax=Limosilactobacillus reuteri TaxID=1598 RepID=UPI003995855E
MDTNSSHKHSYLKLFLSTAALAGIVLAESGNAVVKADKVTVQPGDNLITFAQKYNTSVDQLASKNQISDPNHIEVGQSIETSDDDQAVTTVIVKAGDTVSSLANQYNTTIQRITQDNNLGENYTIIVGQKLKITTNDTTIPVTQQSQQDVPAPQQSVLAQATTPAIANNNQATQNSAPATNTNATQQSAPVSNNSQGYTSSVSGNEASAKAWIAGRESGGNYSARNGQYIGKYQLSSAYLGGDYSPVHQEEVADQYVQGRYGSWTAAQQFWQAHGWY